MNYMNHAQKMANSKSFIDNDPPSSFKVRYKIEQSLNSSK